MSSLSEPANVTLRGKKIFADVIKDLEMKRSPRVIQVGPKSSDQCPYKSHTGKTCQTERGGGNSAMEAETRVMQCESRNPRRHERLEEAKIESPLKSLELAHCPHLYFGLWPLEL